MKTTIGTKICQIVVLILTGSTPVLAQSRGNESERISYGAEATSFGELLLPSGPGPFPVAILIHGGCWLAARGSVEGGMQRVASALAQRGIATWNVEYRRVGHPGGGWPGSYHDLSNASDFVRTLASRNREGAQRPQRGRPSGRLQPTCARVACSVAVISPLLNDVMVSVPDC